MTTRALAASTTTTTTSQQQQQQVEVGVDDEAPPPRISVLYVDEYIVVINKPHGLRSVPGNKEVVSSPPFPPASKTAQSVANSSKTGGTLKTDDGGRTIPSTTTKTYDGGGGGGGMTTTGRGTTAATTAAASAKTGDGNMTTDRFMTVATTAASKTEVTASTGNNSLVTSRSVATTATIPTTTRILTKKRPRELTEMDGSMPLVEVETLEGPESTSMISGGHSVATRLTAQQAWVAAIESFNSSSESNRNRRDVKNIKDTIDGDEKDGVDTATRVKVATARAKALHWISCIADSHPNQLPSVPRKIQPFIRYCQRNQYKWRRKQLGQHQEQQKGSCKSPQKNPTNHPINKEMHSKQYYSSHQGDDNPTIVDDNNDERTATENEIIAREVHSILSRKQRMLMNLPVQTSPEESAYGQVQQYISTWRTTAAAAPAPSDSSPPSSHATHPSDELYVVHRLDCETSGVMVFARTQQAASQLGRYWRNEIVPNVLPVNERAVQKTYIALVENWPPFTNVGETSGVIDVPLSPHLSEKLKWIVDCDNGKASRTIWKISHDPIMISDTNIERMSPVQLDLQPISGRTHQLRIHCANINGTGIIGDSLYGDRCKDLSSPPNDDNIKPLRLYLHARKLSFPHPSTGDRLEFSCDPNLW